MHLAVHELDGMIDCLMRVGVGKPEVGFECVGVDRRALLNSGAHFGGQRLAANVWEVGGFGWVSRLLGPPLDDASSRFLAGAASPLDLPRTLMLVHVFGEAADERLVGLDLAAHFQKRAGL